MRDPEGAKFLFRLAKSARKAWAGLAAVTQDAEDVLATDLGRAVIANSATQILLRQAPQAIARVADEFRLSAGERQLLLSARRGEGLLAAGPSARVSFQALASPAEHYLCTIAAITHNLLRAAGSLAGRRHAKARAATVRRDLIAVAARTARHGRDRLTLHLPEGWHRQHEWRNLFEAACGPPATAA